MPGTMREITICTIGGKSGDVRQNQGAVNPDHVVLVKRYYNERLAAERIRETVSLFLANGSQVIVRGTIEDWIPPKYEP
jgi:hypothetical protein